MDAYTQELLNAHEPAFNQRTLKESTNVLLKALERGDTSTVLVAADWVGEIVARLKLVTRIQARTAVIEKHSGKQAA